jgi:hypothetical protein
VRCWEFNKCGHEPGGAHASDGVCPRSQATTATCWSVINTLCHGAVQSQFREKLAYCLKCPYFVHVIGEQTGGAQLMKQLFTEKPEESAGGNKG